MPQPSLIQPIGYSTSSCGYCSAPGVRSAKKESLSYGFWAHQLSVEFYDWLMNRGWRRSGKYLYHPDMARTCCPQYTIRLEANAFTPSKKQKRILNSFDRLILTGSDTWSSENPHALISPAKPGKGKYNTAFDLQRQIHLAEEHVALTTSSPYPPPPPPAPAQPRQPAHKLRVFLHPSDPPHPAVHPIYQRYQAAIHKDPKAFAPDNFSSFSRFLCDSPLSRDPISYPTAPARQPDNLIDGVVVAFAVLDIVPTGVSSVYFCYEPEGPFASVKWGKISALREIALVRDMQDAGLVNFKYEYLGFYVHSCTKMRYKGEYRPSELLDPGTNVFHPLEPLVPHLEAHPRGAFPFAHPSPPPILWNTPSGAAADPAPVAEDLWVDEDDMNSDDNSDDDDEGAFPSPPPPSFLDPSSVQASMLGRVNVIVPGRGYTTLAASPMRRSDEAKQALSELIAALHGAGSQGEGVLLSDQLGLIVVAP